MELQEARYVLAVSEYGTISAAAKALYMAQPALSRYISRAEARLGVTLFDRSTTPLTLTYAGEEYLKAAREILQINDRMTKVFRDISKHLKGRIRLGIPRDRGAYMLPLFLPAFQQQYPGIQVQVTSEREALLKEKLIKGHLDFLILPNHMVEERGFLYQHLFREELFLVTKRGTVTPDMCHPQSPGVVDLCRTGSLTYLVLQKGHTTRRTADILMRAYGLNDCTKMEVASNTAAYRMASAGLGVAIVPEGTIRMVQRQEDTQLFSLGIPPVEWEIVAVYRQGDYIGQVEQALFDLIREIFSNRPAIGV